ncbi:MAG: rRNA methyltransferase [Flavobacteriales bacterium CG_4_9_14_0_2_um_filter_35_242]|nr:RNA methyltransferase [Zetaproteobacteria bacterium]NDK17876.1 RNA methyltransferase [Flavobacteriales bacterium]PIR14077.1 MAG: rRNA methyltransferase [Flavobacteriales bacterium CG11_big_fil_rev_8_21_14_0_20_35_7]PIV16926.1 MAG: rRNA methyltransferase [Flavobacteriales bacterium CG03_land_8_20_14_0_80_35_15]PIX06312.1 MAG: rRNA methyltransferase [Flavobacteriales bacterium CG_4_8_14_3_um_filter_35_10]PJA04834.1 MAG: rRNA methyltransferase [Flavobacteriales bacterium CG_4_10_14_0_2_um_filt
MSEQEALLTYLQTFLTSHRQDLFKTILQDRTRHFTVVFENIFMKHNASAVLRSCDVFGIQDVYAIENTYIFKASKQVTKGANKWLNIVKYHHHKNNTLACINDLKTKGYQIVATSPHNNPCTLQDFDVTKKSAFFFGVEKEGLSNEVLKHADVTLKIPMYGFSESLNISVAAAIILQHCTQKIRDLNVDWQLTQSEKAVLELEWTKKSIKNVDEIINYFLN